MSFKNKIFWNLALKNLLRNLRRSVATYLAMTMGFTGIVLLSGYILRSERFLYSAAVYVEHNGNFKIMKKSSNDAYWSRPKKYLLMPEDIRIIDQLLIPYQDKIERKTSSLEMMGLVSNGTKSTPFIALGINPQDEVWAFNHPYMKSWAFDLIIGRNETFTNFNDDSISMTNNMGQILNIKMPQDFGKDIQIAGTTVEGDLNAINGVLTAKHTTGMALSEDTSLTMTLKSMQNLMMTDGVKSISIYLKNRWDTNRIYNEIRNKLIIDNLPFEIFAFYQEEVGQTYIGNMGFLWIMGYFFIVLIMGAVAMIVTNTTTLGLLERIREIGTLRAFGFTPKHVEDILKKEGMILFLLSILTGSIISKIIIIIINSLKLKIEPPGLAGDFTFFLITEWWLMVLMAIPIFIATYFSIQFVVRKKLKNKIINLLTE